MDAETRAVRRRWAWVTLAALMVVGGALRAWPIGSRPLWYDEVMTWKSVMGSSVSSILLWRHHHEHPPLSYLLVKGCVALFGSDAEWVLRMPSLIAGVLCIPAAYVLGCVVRGRAVGLVAAGFAAFDFNGITQSQQARMYTLALLATLLASAAAVVALRRPTAWRWAIVGAAAAAAFLANNSGLAILLAAPASVLVVMPVIRGSVRRRRALFLGGGVAASVGLVLLLPGVPAMIDRIDWYGARSLEATLVDRLRGLVLDFGSAYGGWPVAAAVAAAGTFGLMRIYPRRRAAAGFLLLLLATSTLLLLPVEPHGFEPRPRYVMLAQVPLWIGLAVLLTPWCSRGHRFASAAAVALLGAWLIVQSLTEGEHWRYEFGNAAREVRSRVSPGDAVVFYPAWIEAVPWYYGLRPTHQPPPWGGASELASQPLETISPVKPTWLTIAYHLETGATDAAPDMIAAIAERYGVTVDRARAAEVLRRHPIVVARVDGDGVSLQGFAEPDPRYAP